MNAPAPRRNGRGGLTSFAALMFGMGSMGSAAMIHFAAPTPWLLANLVLGVFGFGMAVAWMLDDLARLSRESGARHTAGLEDEAKWRGYLEGRR